MITIHLHNAQALARLGNMWGARGELYVVLTLARAHNRPARFRALVQDAIDKVTKACGHA